MEIYDYVEAATLGDEPSEQIVYQNDYLEVSHVVHDNGAVLVRGYSHVSGDTATYIIPEEVEVGLWTA